MLIEVKAILHWAYIYMHNVLADQMEKNGKAVKGLRIPTTAIRVFPVLVLKLV